MKEYKDKEIPLEELEKKFYHDESQSDVSEGKAITVTIKSVLGGALYVLAVILCIYLIFKVFL